ncbi:hypothetical protein BLA6993_04856 [Burkholderia lata]|uniref:hypothetical protein n=1 Tax=Burkholderia lata (strain ATCC 17760 / DSM 23089 / LMG 22485 / NCIMB 9086 / R18194 / 383) TaxID=482957 RepID=UPI0014532E46|nr:hypothetical protein [Burkholderia lata]VWC01264.1 hypothetical protein BLA6993_04856 [Burkholderia lata]
MKKLIVGITLIAASVAGNAQNKPIFLPGGFVDGNGYQTFDPLTKRRYLEGVFDGILYAPAIAVKDLPRAVKLHDCTAGHSMTDAQIAAIVDKFMADNPERWGEPMSNIAYTAMLLTCRKLGTPAE